MKLSDSEKANLERIAARVEYTNSDPKVVEWFRYGIEKNEPVPDDVAAVERGLQYLRTYLSTDGPYKKSAPALADKLTKLINADQAQEAGDMLTAYPKEAALPEPITPAASRRVYGTPFSGSQQGAQNRRLSSANRYAAWRVQVPAGQSGAIDTITPWLRWTEPGYGAGTFGSFTVGIYSDVNDAPGSLVSGTDARNNQAIIAAGETNNNLGEAAFPEMDMGSNYFPASGDCFWIVIQNTDSDPGANNFSLNGLQIRPRSVLQDSWPTMPCQKYVESSDGVNWSELTGNYEMLPYFCISSEGTRWGMPYSVSDLNVVQLNSGDTNFSGWAINGVNQWRTKITTTEALANAEYKFYTSKFSGSDDLQVIINGTTHTVAASQIPLNTPPGVSSYYDGNNWTRAVISLGDLPAGTHDIEFSTTAGTEYVVGTTGVLPGADDCEVGGQQHAAQINTGSGWDDMLLWGAVPNSRNRLQSYIEGDLSTAVVDSGVPFEFVGLSVGDTIQTYNQLVSWQNTDGSTTRQFDLLVREAQYGPFTTLGDTDNTLHNTQGLGAETDTATQPVPWPNNGESLYIRLLGSGPNGWAGWDAVAEGHFIDITVTSWTQPVAPPSTAPFELVGLSDGDTLSSIDQLLNWQNTDGSTQRRFHLFARLASFGPFSTTTQDAVNTFYNSQGLATNTDTSTEPVNWPSGEQVYVRLESSDPAGVWSNWNPIAEGAFIDFTLTIPTATASTSDDISMAGLSQLTVPTSIIPEGSWTAGTWASTLPPNSSLIFSSLEANISSKIINGDYYINARMDPLTTGSAGTNRPELGINIPDDTHYRMVFETSLPTSFDYGINLNQRTAKLGPGFASDKSISGGSSDTDGFSARLNMRANNTLLASQAWWCIYSYAANRNNQFGDDLFLLNEDGSRHIIQKGALYRFGVEVKMNSVASASDGFVKVWVQVDGAPKWLALDQQGVQWWGSGTPSIERIFWQMFHGGNSPDWRPANSNDICFRSLGWAKGAFPAEEIAPVTGATMTYAQIRAAGRAENGYPTAYWADAHLGEFLYLNPDVCGWINDEVNEVITAVDIPTPVNPVIANAPSGSNNSSYINSLIANNSGRDLVFNGVYDVGSTINVNRSVRIFGLETRTTGSVGVVYKVTAANVEIYDSPINANNLSSAHDGWVVETNANNFVLCGSGIENINHPGNADGHGVLVRGAENFRIAGNKFNNMINDGEAMRAVRVSSNANEPQPKGYVVNNESQNIQAVSSPTSDPEFFVCQGYSGSTDYIRVMANRCIDAGKRLTKWQHPDGFVASNYYEWRNLSGPLGNRSMLNIGNSQLDANNITYVNNRIKIARGRWTALLAVSPEFNGATFRNIHFDNNDIEIVDAPTANFYALGFYFKNKDGSSADSRNQLVDCSIKNNVLRGPGGTNFIFSFDAGFDDDASSLGIDISGNQINTPVHISDFRGSSTNYTP